MKQTIPFVKDINFKSKIYEITSISLEQNLKMENNDSIIGAFIVSGKYKISMVSVSEEEFEETLDFDITLDDKYDASKVKINIDDFYYEIIDEEKLRVHIIVLVDNLVYMKKNERCIEEEKIIKTNVIDNQKEESTQPIIEEKEEIITDLSDNKLDSNDEKINISSISGDFLAAEEKYVTYKIHIIRDNENIETIKEKYKVTTDELEKYNDIKNIVLGSKIIVPLVKNDE